MPESQLRDPELCTRIRWRIDVALLPVVLPGLIRSGYGVGHRSQACDLPIAREEIEYQVDLESGFSLSLYMGCYVLWQIECLARIRAEQQLDRPKRHELNDLVGEAL